MNTKTTAKITVDMQFRKDVDIGLSAKPKHLSSMYFYDKKGDELFMQIMQLPEYYLTRAELEVFSEQTLPMIEALKVEQDTYFELIELGAGDGSKTKHLLKALLEQGFDFTYIPIDISPNVLEHLQTALQEELPTLSIKPQQGDYFTRLGRLKEHTCPKVVLFLGSNIGNMNDDIAAGFISELGKNLSTGDKLLLGVDRIKSEDVVLPAYNDSQGVTSEFNLNLLRRINKELGANFDLQQFKHVPEYDADEGIARSYLQSQCDQTVTISSVDKAYEFTQGEKIHMEVSRKYNEAIINSIVRESGFRIVDHLTDQQEYFSDYIFEKT